MKQKWLNEIKGLLIIAAGLIVLASVVSFDRNDLSFYTSSPNIPAHNLIGSFGALLSGFLFYFLGWSSFILPVFLIWLGVCFFVNNPVQLRWVRIFGVGFFTLSFSSILALSSIQQATIAFSRGGLLGYSLAKLVETYFGRFGGFILFSTFILLAFGLVTESLISLFLLTTFRKVNTLLVALLHRKEQETKKPTVIENIFRRKKIIATPSVAKAAESEKLSQTETDAKISIFPQKPKLKIKEQPSKEEQSLKSSKQKTVKIGDYQLPPLDLLDNPPPLEARQIKEDLANNARILEETLADFGITVKVTDIERGPIITRYELEPAPGVKINRIVTLSDDIALAMKAQSVRIVAPIPGKARVGVEVPNNQSSLVYIKEIISSKEFQQHPSKLCIAIGKDIAGIPVIGDLQEMPHLLIAGTTGSGKTVCVNSVILSLLMRSSPNELKFVMIDPKMVEMAAYNGLPHLLCPVVTESKKASCALSWVVNEMERRYRVLAEAGARNILVYNEKKPQQTMPFIVVIIDEFADLMVVARDQVESAVTRLAQLSRAVGIHLVLATQRPSVDVITGVIKANMPARISFKVASKVDSRTVLDMNGADKLLGKGDLLFLRPQDAKLTRAQGALVTDEEIERVVSFIKKQAQPVYNEEITNAQQKAMLANAEKDELYDEAVRIIIETNQPSVSILQRRLRLGYTRAARIIDMMEMEGLVGPFEGSKPRKLLVDREQWLKQDMLKRKQAQQAQQQQGV